MQIDEIREPLAEMHEDRRGTMSLGISTAGASHTREVDPLTVTQRLQREGRWKDIEHERDEMMKLARKQGMSKSEAQQWVYAELDRLYPPLSDNSERANDAPIGATSYPFDDPDYQTKGDGGQIQGLGAIPDSWPELPANASLAAELGWVQANRLRIVTEKPGKATVVDLARALSPAPSWAALGWLETSIRSYAKFVDVAAKATSSDEGEQGVMRRERMAIEEVERLIEEVRADVVCRHCGEPI